MKCFTIHDVRISNGQVCVTYVADDDPADIRETQYPPIRLSTFMAEYSLDDPAEALSLMLHGPHADAWLARLAQADDPAVAAGWVTTTDPDSEAVALFNARVGTDAREAYRCRVAALRETEETIADPAGMLGRTPGHDPNTVRTYREVVDTARWEMVYGGLPLPEPVALAGRIPTQQRG